MLCQNCKKNESSFSYMQVVNGVVTKISICKECAKEKNINQIDININIPFSVKDLFASIIDANKIDESKSENFEELIGNQSKIDVADPKGKITAADFKKLRNIAIIFWLIFFHSFQFFRIWDSSFENSFSKRNRPKSEKTVPPQLCLLH